MSRRKKTYAKGDHAKTPRPRKGDLAGALPQVRAETVMGDFEKWVRKEIDITILTDEGTRVPPMDETVAMAQAVRARCLDDLMREGPLSEESLVARSLPPESRHVAPMREFVVGILNTMAEEGEVIRSKFMFGVTDKGRAAFPEARAGARRHWRASYYAPDNDRGRPAL